MQRNPDWLGSETAAHYLGISSRTLYRLIDEGQVAGYRFGRVIRLRRADLDAFIQASRIQPGELRHLYAGSRSAETRGQRCALNPPQLASENNGVGSEEGLHQGPIHAILTR